MYRLLDLLLRRIVRAGDLMLIDSQGMRHRYGDGAGSPVVARIADKWLEHRLLLDPHLAVGEGYMSGRLRMERGRIYDLLAILASTVQRRPLPQWTADFDAVRFIIRRIMQFSPSERARRNVAHHYDIDGAIYDLFLDRGPMRKKHSERIGGPGASHENHKEPEKSKPHGELKTFQPKQGNTKRTAQGKSGGDGRDH